MTARSSNIIILQCRTGSTRLPGKALLPLGGLPIAILAARRVAGPGKRVVLATSDQAQDDVLADEAQAHEVEVFRGSLDDVLGRFVGALGDAPDDALVTRLTGDNPVPDHRLVDEVASEMEARGLRYITTTHPNTGLPYGLSVEIMRAGDLREAAREAQAPAEREHVTPYLIRRFGASPYEGRKALKRGAYRMTIDSLDDYLSMRKVFHGVSDPVGIAWTDLVARVDRGLYQPTSPEPVRRFVMGTVQLGMPYGVSRAQSAKPGEKQAMIKTAIANGCVCIDTARAYASSEQVIGNTLSTGWAGRSKVITKLDPLADMSEANPATEWAAATELSVMRSCVELRVQRLDTVLLHRAEHMTVANGAVWDRLCALQQQGRIDRLGVSVQSPQELSAVLDSPRVTHVQLPCNILDTRWHLLVKRIVQRRADTDLVVHLRSLFLQGLLFSQSLEDWRRARVEDPESVQNWLLRMVEQCGRDSVADLCLAWAQAQEWSDGIVVGADNLAQLEQNLALFRKPPLTAEQLALIDASRPAIALETLDPARWTPRQS
jgi:spore coat polysaccharide biosynthesis protein SpsF